ncbi:hypothetical protein [Ruegeria sp. MALMAid1280]|uniref:hypothetical protein n=1 Tax=Ruegeria sp. MALMAid1280 TaxID=3411634 RepID=UPI003B9DF2F5
MQIQGTPATKALLTFIQDYNEALQNASLLLGGQFALRRVQFLIDHLATQRSLTRRAKLDLVAMHKLLTLQNVGDPERIETALFANIDPADPVVEELCLLSDALLDHMRAVDTEADLPVFELELAA